MEEALTKEQKREALRALLRAAKADLSRLQSGSGNRTNGRIDLGLGVISLNHLGLEGKGVDSIGVGGKSTVPA